jgi:peptidoglycan-associated lipoprotein
MKRIWLSLPLFALAAGLLTGCGPKCPLDPSIKADDPKCVACSHDAKIIQSSPECKPCKLNPSISSADAQCKPCQWNPDILASNAACVEPKKEEVKAPEPPPPPPVKDTAAERRARLQGLMNELLSQSAYFDYNESTLKPEGKELLKKVGDLLKAYPELSVKLEGNCDERGSDEYNLALGEKRAKAAQTWLTNYGVKEAQLSFISYGKEKPAVDGHDEDSWAKNRRDGFSGEIK